MADRAPAQGSERAGSEVDRALILDFANTLDVEASTDDLVTRAQLADFLQRAGVVDGRAAASEQDVALARELRSGIRSAMHLNHDEVRAEVPELSRVLTRLPMRLGWTAGARASSRSRRACLAVWRRSRSRSPTRTPTGRGSGSRSAPTAPARRRITTPRRIGRRTGAAPPAATSPRHGRTGSGPRRPAPDARRPQAPTLAVLRGSATSGLRTAGAGDGADWASGSIAVADTASLRRGARWTLRRSCAFRSSLMMTLIAYAKCLMAVSSWLISLLALPVNKLQW